ncbi:DNA translocase FtsK, partial [Candidatus Nomurabacteria bacterium]|nr:DNA translocase FtsK [Candidatus Nomurabacteria bacterium]
LGTNEFQHSEKPLLISLGKGVSGRSHFGNLGKMPHLLIAGATGSGKSVTIHSIITSLLYRNSPSNLKFIMIDPKRVELTLYNKIPHLLTPVITEAKKTILALRWAAKEMDRRYDILEAESVRDIESYHKNVLEPELKKIEARQKTMKEGDLEDKMPETMPYIVIVIDELADIMQTYPRELESAIVRLAQMSRAVGIHLMVSTQRPSVNVITGLIKANIPARVALQVASQVDSRTILDASGAEKLLGSGDMLYISGEMSKPVRLQSPYISEKELKTVVKHIIDSYQDELPNEINITGENEKNLSFEAMGDLNGGLSGGDSGGGLDDDDELYEQAKEVVISAGKASTSYIQRKLRVGYARAARLIDMLEERGVIGPGDGAKAREVIGIGTVADDDHSDDTTGTYEMEDLRDKKDGESEKNDSQAE